VKSRRALSSGTGSDPFPAVEDVPELRNKWVRAKYQWVGKMTDFGRDVRGWKRAWMEQERSKASLDGLRITTVPEAKTTQMPIVKLGKTFPQFRTANDGSHRKQPEQGHYLHTFTRLSNWSMNCTKELKHVPIQ
jgi:hypothetical protein